MRLKKCVVYLKRKTKRVLGACGPRQQTQPDEELSKVNLAVVITVVQIEHVIDRLARRQIQILTELFERHFAVRFARIRCIRLEYFLAVLKIDTIKLKLF